MRAFIPRSDKSDLLENPYTDWKDIVRYFVASAWMLSEDYRLQTHRYMDPLYSDIVIPLTPIIDFLSQAPYAICASSELHLRYQRTRPK